MLIIHDSDSDSSVYLRSLARSESERERGGGGGFKDTVQRSVAFILSYLASNYVCML